MRKGGIFGVKSRSAVGQGRFAARQLARQAIHSISAPAAAGIQVGIHMPMRVLLTSTMMLLLGAHGAAAQAPGAAGHVFFDRLAGLCGARLSGVITENQPPPPADDPFVGQELTAWIRDCSANEIRIPFWVGEDRSRTWIVTRTGEGLRLKHDHRKGDGSPDTLTMYGGNSTDTGTSTRQNFPADEETLSMFTRQGLEQSLTNVWSLEIVPDDYLQYELSRPTGRLFRVRFSLRR